MTEYTVLRSFTFEGQEYIAGTKIPYDLDELDGNDYIRIVREAQSDGKDLKLIPAADPTVQAALFAEAANKPVEFVRAMKLCDFVAATAEVAAFLMNSDSEESEKSPESSEEQQSKQADS